MPTQGKTAVVTGASRGIGEALAASLLAQDYRVYGISRSASPSLAGSANYTAIACDLSDSAQTEAMADRLFRELAADPGEELLLINNAAMLEPLGPIESLSAAEMSRHLQTSLLAPMTLSSAFVRHAQQLPIAKRIVNVTSSLAIHSAPSMSLYCSSKAALNMLTRCIADEQRTQPYPILAYALDPGMTETRMQETARGRDKEAFPLQSFFRESFEQGRLQSPERVAAETLRLLADASPSGSVLHAYQRSQ
ncbi:SDR family NAD(P)-dependent oxidoreductase [Paenibacillus rhizovicinus]|uniref:SDR family NAD(P)-dependent oxidoreductase n=1 Tax=Paenibacillus rhizovicinus TaxID=2704463 RepID=A0A6C0NUV5_9BACL|nr:SDR family NAD(P)-dependent oxidoreductase [Paenibacillus rhizovicinus]QHW29965.1 SDR family NAD(P)-dependent oxidoreductase [Paenibacillus rhizovicinus]